MITIVLAYAVVAALLALRWRNLRGLERLGAVALWPAVPLVYLALLAHFAWRRRARRRRAIGKPGPVECALQAVRERGVIVDLAAVDAIDRKLRAREIYDRDLAAGNVITIEASEQRDDEGSAGRRRVVTDPRGVPIGRGEG